MLSFVYAKDDPIDKEFMNELIHELSTRKDIYLDNFDYSLLIQTCKFSEGTLLKDDNEFQNNIHELIRKTQNCIPKFIDYVNVQQFVTITNYLLEKNLGSDTILNFLKNQIVKHLDEFNDVELLLLKRGLVLNKLVNNDHIITIIDE